MFTFDRLNHMKETIRENNITLKSEDQLCLLFRCHESRNTTNKHTEMSRSLTLQFLLLYIICSGFQGVTRGMKRTHHFIISRRIKEISGKTMIVNLVNDMIRSPAIHIVAGDVLSVNVTNNIPDHGLSIHWHGFEMKNKNIFDGVVGLTQCAIAPGESFLYEFNVHEIPGTYWWHTHSGIDPAAQDLVRGPLIVHPPGTLLQDLKIADSYSYMN